MSINKRIRSFSPYTYNVKYRQPGSDPLHQDRSYSNFINTPEEHFVVSKKNPNFKVFVRNLFVYSYDDQCNNEFVKGESVFQIVSINDRDKRDFFNNEYISEQECNFIYLSDTSFNDSFMWISKSEIITNETYDNYFDYIILKNDKEYINASVTLLESGKLKFKFDHDINNKVEKINIILFNLKDPSNIENYEIADLNKESVEFNNIRNMYSIKNIFNSIDSIPIIFNRNGERHMLTPDITPSYILILNDQINSIKSLKNKNNELNNNINSIINENLSKSLPELYSENELFRDSYESLKNVNKITENMNNEGINNDIEKIIIYRPKYSEDFILRYGINTKDIIWDNNSVIITHNLDGYVKVTIDDAQFILDNYKIEYISSNEIKITFNRSDEKEHYVNVFKI